MEKKNKRIVISIVLVIIILGIMIWTVIEECIEKQIPKETKAINYETQKTQTGEINKENNSDQEQSLVNEEEKIYPKEEIETSYKGYTVSAKLEIPAINLETYVLQKYSLQALNVTVTKFWGANANQIGNYCIAGHNFQNRNMFFDLKKLKIGDKLSIVDNEVGRVEYKIYDIYQVMPEDVSCLSQETDGKKEVTLITCTNDSKRRIIIKSRECLKT